MSMHGRPTRDIARGTFVYVEGTTGNMPSWPYALPTQPVFAAMPKQHDAMVYALLRAVIEAVEQNKCRPVPFYRNALNSLKEIEEIVKTHHTTFGVTMAPPHFRRWIESLKVMYDHPDANGIVGAVADAVRGAYDFGVPFEKIVTLFSLIYGDG